MKNTKTITILCLLASVMIAPFAIAESATVLLKQGIYVEETEGDLDKAIEIYKQVLDKAAKIQRLASRATYQLGMCHLKKGEKETATKYFQQLISKYPTQKTLVKKAAAQLKKIKPETKESVFEQIDDQVTRFLGEKFGETAAEAGQNNLLVNSNIYYVDRDGFSYHGGMNGYYNWTGQTTGKKVHFGGTGYRNQTHYGVDGHELNTEIVPDKTRPNHWQIYWIPDEPLAPGESLYYGWSKNDKQKLSKMPGDVYSLTMQNKYGSAVIETFFLVLPKDVEISKSNPPTASKELLNFNVYWWTKTVQRNENHLENVQLKIAGITAASSHADLQDMIDNAEPSSTVIVPDGVYTEPIRINKDITLQGSSRDGCILEVTANEPAIMIDTAGKGNVKIDNLTIKWQLATSDKGIEFPMAIAVKDAKAKITNCVFRPLGNAQRSPVAIRSSGFTTMTIDNCDFEGFDYVICFGEGTSGGVYNSYIADCGHQGVICYSGAKMKVEGNIITGSKYHAVRNTGGELRMANNLIIDNANRGVYLGNKSGRGTIMDNIIAGNGTGIGGFARSKYKIVNNVIMNNSYSGISMEKSCNFEIGNNIFMNNERGWVMFDRGQQGGNTSLQNTFWENKVDAENFSKTGNSITEEPQFRDAENGDFSLTGGMAKEAKHGLKNAKRLWELWQKWQERKKGLKPSKTKLPTVTKTDTLSVVEKAIKTISICADGDARIDTAMASIKSLDESAVITELKKYLTSDKDTIRRSAIYALWRGEFSNITAAEAELEKLCSHEEDLTRGMAGLALGQNKVLSSFTILEKMTLDDPSGYARRCGAYALGLMEDARAKPILEKALTDSNRLVQNNADAALAMLELKPSKAGTVANPSASDRKKAEDLTARGWKLWGQQKLAEAEEKFKQAIAKDPKAENAYQGLGWAQLNQGKKLNAKDSFEKCVKLNPKNSAALNGLGWIAHGQDNIDEAIQWWEKAVTAQPGTTASLSGLTQVYMDRKEYDKAIKYYKMWLKAEPNNEQAKEGLKKAKASK